MANATATTIMATSTAAASITTRGSSTTTNMVMSTASSSSSSSSSMTSAATSTTNTGSSSILSSITAGITSAITSAGNVVTGISSVATSTSSSTSATSDSPGITSSSPLPSMSSLASSASTTTTTTTGGGGNGSDTANITSPTSVASTVTSTLMGGVTTAVNPTSSSAAGRVDDTTTIVLGTVLGLFLFTTVAVILILWARRLQMREDEEVYGNDRDFSKMHVEPKFTFHNPAADYEDDDELVVRDSTTADATVASAITAMSTLERDKNRSDTSRSERSQTKASIADHDVVVGSMKDLEPIPSTSVTVQPLYEQSAETAFRADDSAFQGDAAAAPETTQRGHTDEEGQSDVAAINKTPSPGIQRGGPRGATVAVVRVNAENEFEDAVRLARKPPQSMKVRSTFGDNEEMPLAIDFEQVLARSTPERSDTEPAGRDTISRAKSPKDRDSGSCTPVSMRQEMTDRRASLTPSLQVTLCADDADALPGNRLRTESVTEEGDTIVYPLGQPPPKRPITPKPNRQLRPTSTTSIGSTNSAGYNSTTNSRPNSMTE